MSTKFVLQMTPWTIWPLHACHVCVTDGTPRAIQPLHVHQLCVADDSGWGADGESSNTGCQTGSATGTGHAQAGSLRLHLSTVSPLGHHWRFTLHPQSCSSVAATHRCVSWGPARMCPRYCVDLRLLWLHVSHRSGLELWISAASEVDIMGGSTRETTPARKPALLRHCSRPLRLHCLFHPLALTSVSRPCVSQWTVEMSVVSALYCCDMHK